MPAPHGVPMRQAMTWNASESTAVPSVLIQKFLFNFIVDVECSPAEAVDGGEDIVGGLGPAERSGIAVAGVDVLLDGGFEFGRRSVGAALDLLFGQESEEALDLVDP